MLEMISVVCETIENLFTIISAGLFLLFRAPKYDYVRNELNRANVSSVKNAM